MVYRRVAVPRAVQRPGAVVDAAPVEHVRVLLHVDEISRPGVQNYSTNVIAALASHVDVPTGHPVAGAYRDLALTFDGKAFDVEPIGAKVYYGVELEVETKLGWRTVARHFPAMPQLSKRPPLIAKADGSLHDIYGMELVTLPATFPAQVELWKALDAPTLKGKMRSYNGTANRCGLHIHVSRDALPAVAQKVIDYLVGHVDNQPLTEYFARRAKSQYCKHHNKRSDGLGEPTTGEHSEHYQAVSFSQHFSTIEFRIYKGTTLYSGVLLCLEHCNSVVEYAVDFASKHKMFAPCKAVAGKYLAWLQAHFKLGKWQRLAQHIAAMPEKLDTLQWSNQATDGTRPDALLLETTSVSLPSKEDF